MKSYFERWLYMLVQSSDMEKIDFKLCFKILHREVFPEIRGHERFPGKPK